MDNSCKEYCFQNPKKCIEWSRSHQCMGITSENTRCSRSIRMDNDYCFQHIPKDTIAHYGRFRIVKRDKYSKQDDSIKQDDSVKKGRFLITPRK